MCYIRFEIFFEHNHTIRIFLTNLTLYEKYEFLMQKISMSEHVMFQHRTFCATIYITVVIKIVCENPRTHSTREQPVKCTCISLPI
jgi:hypothetical protein